MKNKIIIGFGTVLSITVLTLPIACNNKNEIHTSKAFKSEVIDIESLNNKDSDSTFLNRIKQNAIAKVTTSIKDFKDVLINEKIKPYLNRMAWDYFYNTFEKNAKHFIKKIIDGIFSNARYLIYRIL